jgi:ATP-dependent DNA ligase
MHPINPLTLKYSQLAGEIDTVKYDGYRAVARIKANRCQLISRNGNPFASLSDLAPVQLLVREQPERT